MLKEKPAESSSDSLKSYRDKRNFERTPEPKPQGKLKRKVQGQFVVQKHDARRLHFDLRLEVDGVLKSWAVTKGPSLNPDDKRLAVQTEDHPIGYLDWEGIIPKGEYGAGTMIVWDRGDWKPVGDAARGLAKGHLDFELSGKRLKGRWHLVRMQKKSGEKHTPWLLIKSKDEHSRSATDADIVAQEMTSAVSGHTNDELADRAIVRTGHASRAKSRGTSARLAELTRFAGVRKAILPVFVEPSLAMLQEEAPKGDSWLHEIKYDGYRIQARLDGGSVQLLTRKGLDWTHRFASIANALKELKTGAALIDGELIVQDSNGHSSFSGLQADLKSGRKDRMAYFVFDLLYLDGADLRGAALTERKKLLRELIGHLPESSRIRFSDHIQHDGQEMLGQACRMGLEGIVSKRQDLPYISGRGPHWVKSKCVHRQEFVIIGYVPSSASADTIGSVVLGYYDKAKLVHVGRAGTGFSDELARDLRAMFDRIAASKPSFAKPLQAGAGKDVKWIAPDLVAEVEFRDWTSDGLLRQASFKGLREDKDSKEIGLEQAPKTAAASRSPVAESFKLTHPDRVLWEDQGVTKRGLAEFYAEIADWILPHVTRRVLSLVRCPGGAEKQCFYAKHAWQGVSDAIHPVDVGNGETMLMIENLRGLMGLVQAGVLEIHPWGSRIDDIEKPDRLIMDLDPGPGVGWPAVIDAALEMRTRLKGLKLKSFVKTSGGKGLHVVVPLTPDADWETAKAFSKSIAEAMAADAPDRYVAVMTKKRRNGRIFIDYLRNGRGATAVAAYSTRAKPNAPVSTPLDWDELSPAIASDHYTIGNLRQRLDHLKHDPWAELMKIKQKLPRP